MRKGASVKLRRYVDYGLTKTEAAYSYTGEMRELAESGAKMKVLSQSGNLVRLEYPEGETWSFHKDDVIFNMSFVNK